jgi:hypothetical protein
MPKLGLGLSLANPRIAGGGATQTIWKVAIFGAGEISSNGEYIWDGSELNNYGKPVYRKENSSNSIEWEEGGGPSALGAWNLFDVDVDDLTYQIESLSFSGSWIVAGAGTSPSPSSALSYSQDSFISSITLTGSNPGYDADGVYTRASGGTTSFIGSGSKIIEWDGTAWITESVNYGSFFGTFFNWEPYAGSSPDPVTTNAVYSA